MDIVAQISKSTLALVVIFTAPHIFSAFLPSLINESSGWMFLLVICAHIAFVAYFYISKKHNLFVLPVCHIIFPFIFYLIMMFLWRYSTFWKGFETSWESYVILVGVFYFLPSAIITLIISKYIDNKR